MKKHHLLASLFALGCLGAGNPAAAVTCSQAFVFATGQTLTATNLNANPANEVTCINNIDHTNLGSAGIYASQIIPATAPQAAFGGALTYTFPAGISAIGAVVAGSASAPAFNPGDLVASQTASIGVLRLGGSSSTGIVDYGASNAGALTLGDPTFVYGALKAMTLAGTGPTTSSGDLSGTRSTITGALSLGGSSSSGALDYGVTTAGTFTSSAPLNVTGKLQSTANVVAGSGTAVPAGSGYLESSTGVGSGELLLGGTTSFCGLDFGISSATTMTTSCPLFVSGLLQSAASSTSGALKLGNTGSSGTLDYGITHAGAFTVSSPASLYFAANPGGLTGAGLNDYEVGTWTPTDASGAGLTFTGVSGNYVKIGRLVFVTAQLTYPTTASGSSAAITQPFASPPINQLLSLAVVGAVAVDIMNVSGAGFNPLLATSFAPVTNGTLSGKTIVFSGTYESSS